MNAGVSAKLQQRVAHRGQGMLMSRRAAGSSDYSS